MTKALLAARSAFVYGQGLLIRFHRPNGRLAREEKSEYLVTPAPKGFEKKLVRFEGRYERKGKLVDYSGPHFTYKDVDIDGDLISDLAEDFTAEKESRDGISGDLFPFTAHRQVNYEFHLLGREKYRGGDVYRIRFQPRKGEDPCGDGASWAGEVLVDAAEYQPVFVSTHFACKIPLWMKTVLGTDLRQLGFAVSYRKFGHGIWFPVSYGGEFEVKAVFFYKRAISISLANTGFRRAEVTSGIEYATAAER